MMSALGGVGEDPGPAFVRQCLVFSAFTGSQLEPKRHHLSLHNSKALSGLVFFKDFFGDPFGEGPVNR